MSSETKQLYLVEIIRYGIESLGVQTFGIFDDLKIIHTTMKKYNIKRGGKYPEYFVSPVGNINPDNLNFTLTRERFSVYDSN